VAQGGEVVVAAAQGVEVFGVKLLGVTPATGRKLLLTLAFIAVVVLLSRALSWLLGLVLRGGAPNERAKFWSRQGVQLAAAALLVLGLLSIWFEDPTRLAGFAGIVTAGVAIALQRVITSFAAYLIILRGRVFTVGDRITMAGVRGDVVQLGFMQTTVMEMGQPPGVIEQAEPAMWVEARQYTGRVVKITNDKIFDAPVYNFTREFPYIWEEMHLPVSYKDTDKRQRAERILLDAATRHTAPIVEDARAARRELKDTFFLPDKADLESRVYWRLTDNWLELTVRFLAPQRGVRALKDAMSRDILAALDEAGIGIASTTFEIVGLPPLRVEKESRAE
jgi:small-conductance mechanosensitive channel